MCAGYEIVKHMHCGRQTVSVAAMMATYTPGCTSDGEWEALVDVVNDCLIGTWCRRLFAVVQHNALRSLEAGFMDEEKGYYSL
jgi:hypothetical protein